MFSKMIAIAPLGCMLLASAALAGEGHTLFKPDAG